MRDRQKNSHGEAWLSWSGLPEATGPPARFLEDGCHNDEQVDGGVMGEDQMYNGSCDRV